MSMAKKAARHAIILMTSRILGMVIAVSTILCYTRLLEPKELALIPVLQILMRLCYMVFSLGLGFYVQRRMPQLDESDPMAAKQLGRSFTAAMGLGSLVFGLIAFLLSDSIARIFLKDETRSVEIALLIPAILFTSWSEVVLHIMRGRRLFIAISVYILVVQIIHLPVVIGLYLWFGVKGMILGLAVASGLGSIFMSWRLRQYMFGKVSWSAVRRFVTDALPFYGEGYAGYVIAYADQWIIGILMTPVELATYYVPKTIFMRLVTLSDELHSIVLANISTIGSRGLQAVKDVFEKIRRVYIYIFVPLGALLISASFFLIDLLAGAKYHAGAIPFAILCIALLVMGLYAPHTVSVMALAPPRKRFFVVLFQGAIMLGVMFPLVLVFRLSGVAAATLVAKTVGGALSAAILGNLFRYSFDRHAIRVVFLPSVLLLLICGLGQLLFYDRLTVPLYLLFGLMVYFYFFARRISEGDLEIIENILPSRLKWAVLLVRRCRRENAAPAS